MNKSNSTQSVVLVGLFAALTFLGTLLKIPLPTGAFVHLGNAVLLLAVLLIGYKKGALAGGIGFALFDLVNGYAAEAPYFLIESFVVGGAAAFILFLFHHKIETVAKLVTVACAAGIAKICMTQLKNTLMNLWAGASFPVAFSGALSTLTATIINVILTIMLVSFLYFPLKKALASILTSHY